MVEPSALAAPRPIDLSADPLGFHRGHQQQATLQKPSAGFKASSPNLEAARCILPRFTFLSHFVLCLACAGARVFCLGQWRAADHLGERHEYDDERDRRTVHRFRGTSLGYQAWRIREPILTTESGVARRSSSAPLPSSDYGHLAERLCVMTGFVGTAIGLSSASQVARWRRDQLHGTRDVALHHREWWDRGGADRHHDVQS